MHGPHSEKPCHGPEPEQDPIPLVLAGQQPEIGDPGPLEEDKQQGSRDVGVWIGSSDGKQVIKGT